MLRKVSAPGVTEVSQADGAELQSRLKCWAAITPRSRHTAARPTFLKIRVTRPKRRLKYGKESRTLILWLPDDGTIMTSSINELPSDAAKSGTCHRCGAVLQTTVASGVCPACLLQVVALGTGVDSLPAAPWLPPAVEELAASFPQLEIIELIGQGGMGAVYKAKQKSLGRFVALKILAPQHAENPDFAERFSREGQALAEVNHPNIVTVHDFGRAGEFYFLLMEFVDGVSLRQAMKAGRLTPEQALAIVPPICEALQFAHDRGIVHRDIKP